jgi:hypothetical protein
MTSPFPSLLQALNTSKYAPHNNGMRPTPITVPLMHVEWGRRVMRGVMLLIM